MRSTVRRSRSESQQQREGDVRTRARRSRYPGVYVNMVGGQDELVFDGGSFVMDADGDNVAFAPRRSTRPAHCVVLEATRIRRRADWTGEIAELLPPRRSVYKALVTGTRDYVTRTVFPAWCSACPAASIRR